MSPHPEGHVTMVKALQRRAAGLRQPVSGLFELTERCNLACGMCYVRQPANDAAHRARELPAADWVSLAQEAADAGMIFLLLTGGEVFLRRDFFDIYAPLTRMGLILTLFTNGTRVTDRIAARLAEAPPQMTQITLYGASAATYGAVTGVPEAFDHCRAGIEALLRHGVPLELKTTITRQNRDDLEPMRQMARDWGLSLAANWMLMQRRDGAACGAEECRLSPQDCAALAAIERPGTLAAMSATGSGNLSGDSACFACQVGKSSFAINSFGRMLPCLNLDRPALEPRETGFSMAWRQLQSHVDAAPPVDPECASCEAAAHCPRCPAWSVTETGSLTAPARYLCDLMQAKRDLAARQAEGGAVPTSPVAAPDV
ncbi:radical SAM protein with 4Fe4S-binding SPASM domain [Cereibacter ovatus]|uniref:Radical SAM protein with 4Fe4S-binding SPASM domain n=1 Tax=Cereibacter ovatus TaxID=439529 RepID=A0A285D2U7_9RHOB|nr:radical SAM protein [Cereibacter ovatus]SNX74134.1 radical SAM protein with 4Fe4S-binding SPASM domain [Cereibacter ovatus]